MRKILCVYNEVPLGQQVSINAERIRLAGQ